MNLKTRGVILDVDGTLIDSNTAHALAWKKVLDEEGIRNSLEEIQRLIGMGSDKLLPRLAGVEKQSHRGKYIAERRELIFKTEFFLNLKPFPHAKDLLVRMRSHGLRLAIASSARREELHALLQRLEVSELIDCSVCSEDIVHSKPDTDMILKAIEGLGMNSGEIILLGDTPYDIEAANNAGVRAVAVRSGGWSDAHLSGAVRVYENAEEILNNFDNSPFVSQVSLVPPGFAA